MIGVRGGGDIAIGVVGDLLAQQTKARAEGRSDFFPIAPHEMDPLRVARTAAGSASTSDLLKNLLRNCSCEAEDGGSPPIASNTS